MSHKIFMLDDDEKTCKLVAHMLIKNGYDIKTQSEPLLNDRDIKRYQPDLIILDVMMPWLSGDTIADIIGYSFKKRPKIIFYSSKTAEELSELAKEKRVEGYVCKSDRKEALLEKVRAVLSEG